MSSYFKALKKFNSQKMESSEEFLARGGKIIKVVKGDSGKRKTRKTGKIDAQKLLDACNNEAEEVRCVEFLKAQGIEVEE